MDTNISPKVDSIIETRLHPMLEFRQRHQNITTVSFQLNEAIF